MNRGRSKSFLMAGYYAAVTAWLRDGVDARFVCEPRQPEISSVIFDDPIMRIQPAKNLPERCIERPHRRWPVRR